MNNESIFMQRCIRLALNGIGRVSPNPLVGAVVVHDGNIIGEGWHQAYGKPHAEVNAIHHCVEKGFESLLPESILYVNLEPCAHQGKTPPCVDLILQKKFPEVVIGLRDPFSKVNGEGIETLRKSGVLVTEKVMEKECADLNKRFITFHTKKRPYIILKYAQTLDGFIAPEKGEGKIHWISNEYSRILVHKWRSEEDAIMVGANTALQDNPKLTVRDWAGRNPVRISIDDRLSFPQSLQLLNKDASVIIFNLIKNESAGHIEYIKYAGDRSLTEQICSVLHEKNIQSLIIEGGLTLLQEFVNEGMWDEARMFTAPKTFGKGIPAPFISGELVSRDFIDDDEITVLRNIDS